MAKTAENRATETSEEPAKKRAKAPSEVIYRTLGNPAKETFRGHALDKRGKELGVRGHALKPSDKRAKETSEKPAKELHRNEQRNCTETWKGTPCSVRKETFLLPPNITPGCTCFRLIKICRKPFLDQVHGKESVIMH